jgi:hypothetical protein
MKPRHFDDMFLISLNLCMGFGCNFSLTGHEASAIMRLMAATFRATMA